MHYELPQRSGTGSLGDWLNPEGVPVPAKETSALGGVAHYVPAKELQRSEALTTMSPPMNALSTLH